MKLIPGKWYVLDSFGKAGESVSGPFDTREQAENDRQQLNIADDCIVRRYIGRPSQPAQETVSDLP